MQVITVATSSAPSLTTGRGSPAPTARMAAWGGLTMALNSRTPNMPRFEIENVPPRYSSGRSPPLRARAARSFISAEISPRPLRSALRTTGAINPPPVATATETSTEPYRTMPSSDQLALASGISRSARAAARMTKSFTEIPRPAPPRSANFRRVASRRSISQSTVR